jgi:hypothetical protein
MKDDTFSGSYATNRPLSQISSEEATGETIIRDIAKQKFYTTAPTSDRGPFSSIRYRDITIVLATVTILGTIFFWLYKNVLQPIDHLDYRVTTLERGPLKSTFQNSTQLPIHTATESGIDR